MQFEDYLQADTRLQKVDELARFLYQHGDAHIHNYKHARWDTDKIIRIGEEKQKEDLSVLIPEGLLHDTGVAIGPYRDGNVDFHAANGAKIARIFLPNINYSPEEIAKIAVAIEQHNGSDPAEKDKRQWFTSQALFDADTLNKAGIHGLGQYREVCLEWGWDYENSKEDLKKTVQRYGPYSQRLVEHGFYTDTARDIDREMGNISFGGLELVAEFWKTVEEKMRNENLTTEEIIKLTNEHVRIEK